MSLSLWSVLHNWIFWQPTHKKKPERDTIALPDRNQTTRGNGKENLADEQRQKQYLDSDLEESY